MDVAQRICVGYRTLLMYARGATSVRCSYCHTINLAPDAARVKKQKEVQSQRSWISTDNDWDMLLNIPGFHHPRSLTIGRPRSPTLSTDALGTQGSQTKSKDKGKEKFH